MFVNVFTYRAKQGQEDAVIGLLKEWERNRRPHAHRFVSAEVFQDVQDSRNFINIARFEDEAAARVVASDPEQDAWYRRLVSLCEAEPVFTDCSVIWQTA